MTQTSQHEPQHEAEEANEAGRRRSDAAGDDDARRDDAGEGSAARGDATERDADAEDRAKKERVLHTRVPAVLERELKRFAESLRVPVSNLVRTILEDALNVADAATENVEVRLKKAAQQLEHERERLKKRVALDPLADVYAFQGITLAQPATCVKCDRELRPGEHANLGLTDGPPRVGRGRIFVCDACLPQPK